MSDVYAQHGIKRNGVASHLERDFGIRLKATKVTIDGFRKGGYEFI